MKILILETSAYRKWNGGGSFQQAKYYQKLLCNLGITAEIFSGNLWELIKKIHDTDFIIGFGTPLLCSYLQWISFFLNKRGIFCIDTVIFMSEVISDNLKSKSVSKRVILHYVISYITDKVFTRVLPPRLNLINLSSCRFISNQLENTKMKPVKGKFIYPRIEINNSKSSNRNQTRTVLFFGALSKGRGVINLLKACRLLWKKGRKFKLYILGYPVDPCFKKELFDMISKEEKRKIIYREKVILVKDTVKKASVVVLPFRYPCSFQTPYTLLESIAWRVPVVTTDVGSNCEWIKDNRTGLICKKEDIEDIAEKIERIFNDKSLASVIAKNAFQLLKEKYGEPDVLLSTLKQI